MKTRYKILLLNLVLTSLYFLIVWFMINSESNSGNVISSIETIINVIAGYYLMMQYLWVNALWLMFILFGLIKKRREFTIGGAYSIVLSIGILLVLINQ